jgi:hypothetical protein
MGKTASRLTKAPLVWAYGGLLKLAANQFQLVPTSRTDVLYHALSDSVAACNDSRSVSEQARAAIHG